MNVKVELFVELEERLSPAAVKGGSCCAGGLIEVAESSRSLALRNNLHNAIRDLDVSFECVNRRKARWPEGSRRDVMRAECALKRWLFKIRELPAVVVRENRNCLAHLLKKRPFALLYANPPPTVEELRREVEGFGSRH